MSISKEAWLRKSTRELMWHGTSSKLLASILKNGLIPDPKKRSFGEEAPHETGEFSLESMGGIYLSRELKTTYSYANAASFHFGGTSLIVGVQVETTSPGTALDEDSISWTLRDALGLSSSYDSILYYSMWKPLFEAWGHETFTMFEEMEKISAAIDAEDMPVERFLKNLSAEEIPVPPSTKLDGLVSDTLRAMSQFYLWVCFIPGSHEDRDLGRKRYTDARKDYKASLNALSTLLVKKPNPSLRTMRVMTPITYRGANRIVLIAKILNNALGRYFVIEYSAGQQFVEALRNQSQFPIMKSEIPSLES